jgi:hypothetical protein
MNSRTIVGHVGWNSSFDLPVVEVEAADYAFGSNPPYGRGLADRLFAPPATVKLMSFATERF